MFTEFTKHTQRFKVKKYYEVECPDEVSIRFNNRNEIQAFFSNARKDKVNSTTIQKVAKQMAPTYCQPSKNVRTLSSREQIDYLFNEIASGKLNVVLKNNGFRKGLDTSLAKGKGAFSDFSFFIERCAEHHKKACSRIFHADYYILQKTYSYNENTDGAVPSIIDPSSVKEHSTGWKPFDSSFDIAALGAFKGAAAYSTANFLNLGKSALAAAAISANSELMNAQYLVTGKSIITKKWYGSFSVRYNLRNRSFETAWIRYRGCGPEERMLVELKRKDRILIHDKLIYEHPASIVPPFQSMETFLSDYNKGICLPQHNISKPVKIRLLS